jgi:hypothetical protein
MKAALLDVLEYNQGLRERILELEAGQAVLKEQLALREQLVVKGDVYWRRIGSPPLRPGRTP